MKCPYCQAENDRVVDSRASEDGFAIRRRRQCNECGRRFTTYERIERTRIRVIKKDGTRVPFDRDRLRIGLEKACWKRPISAETIDSIVTAVENHLETNFDSEVESRYIGQLVMERLRKVDQVAYVRFASVYRRFEDARDFMEEVRPMLAESHALSDGGSDPP